MFCGIRTHATYSVAPNRGSRCSLSVNYLIYSPTNTPAIIFALFVLAKFFQLLTKSMAYRSRRLNSAFTRVLQKSLYWTESTQCLILIQISLRSILLFSSHLRLDLPFRYMTCSSKSPRLNHPDYIRWTAQTMKFLIAESSPLSWFSKRSWRDPIKDIL